MNLTPMGRALLEMASENLAETAERYPDELMAAIKQALSDLPPKD